MAPTSLRLVKIYQSCKMKYLRTPWVFCTPLLSVSIGKKLNRPLIHNHVPTIKWRHDRLSLGLNLSFQYILSIIIQIGTNILILNFIRSSIDLLSVTCKDKNNNHIQSVLSLPLSALREMKYWRRRSFWIIILLKVSLKFSHFYSFVVV